MDRQARAGRRQPGVVFPFTSTPELARQAAAACKYPPEGLRGAGPGLATFRWPAPEGYYQFANKNVMVIIIIEQARAVEQIDEIASVPGIDVMFIGTNDLSFSLGVGGQQNHPKVQEAIAKVVAAGKGRKIPSGRPAGNLEQLQQKERFSVRDRLLQPLGKSGIDLKTRPLY